jgi:hypothetical protein
MITHMANPVPDGEDFTSFFWGTLVFLALFVACFALWKTVEWARHRKELRTDAVTSQPRVTDDPWDKAVHSRPDGDVNWTAPGAELGGLAGMTQREQEDLFSTYGPRAVRIEMKQRRRARELRARERGQ